MNEPAIPHNEKSRLQALQSLDVLDTPAEERFDRLTRLAKRMFDVPIALVSLVDENRQWFKSCIGLPVSETPRDISFCGHAILGNDAFIINDATKDERFSDNPLVLDEPHIRFYCGYPLKLLDGTKMGTLCIIDTRPRWLDDNDIQSLRDLAEMAESELIAEQQATMDELTGISNRRGFVKLATNSLSLCARQAVPSSLVFLDLNKFKLINDQFGHAEGDRALTVFSDLMLKTFRDSDVLARLGGDEFVVLLTDASDQVAEEVIARFQHALLSYNQASNRGYDISFSRGIVNVNYEQDYSIESLLSRADSLMYDNKREQGLNRQTV